MPPAIWGLNPAFFIMGMVKVPVDTTLAMALPEMEPKSPLAMTATLPGPPILCPTAARGKSTKNFWAPHFSKNAPKITNKTDIGGQNIGHNPEHAVAFVENTGTHPLKGIAGM